VVVSPVGVNEAIVRSGYNGFLAATTEEWIDALERLAKDPELRSVLGNNARRMVDEEYSAQRSAAKFARAVNEALS
jgi:glycosyltransferase involved in cell wall biosynthesis